MHVLLGCCYFFTMSPPSLNSQFVFCLVNRTRVYCGGTKSPVFRQTRVRLFDTDDFSHLPRQRASGPFKADPEALAWKLAHTSQVRCHLGHKCLWNLPECVNANFPAYQSVKGIYSTGSVCECLNEDFWSAEDESKLCKCDSVYLPFILFLNSGSNTHTFTCRSVWSIFFWFFIFLIIWGCPHGRQMALLIFQTDTAFWYLIWWLQCVCVHVRFPRMNSVNLSSEIPCWFVWVCSSSVFCVTFFWQL